MNLKHAFLAGIAGLAFASALSRPALAQQTWRIASNDNMSVDERIALVESWRWQWRFDAARWSLMDGFTRADLIGRNVYDRSGRVVGPIVNDARFVGGGFAGVEVALSGDRALWITPFDLRYNASEGILFTRLSPRQSEERSRLASNNPFPRA